MIKKFNSFSEDLILEMSINESILYFSPDFRFKIGQLNGNKIADELIRLEGDDIDNFDITFINLSDNVGYLTFTPMKKGVEKINAVWPQYKMALDTEWGQKSADVLYRNDINGYNRSGLYWNNHNQIRIGKFIKKLFKGKFGDKEIEEFVNDLKSIQDDPEKIGLVSGEDIRHWYNIMNYYPGNTGTLRNSCMSEKDYFDLYTKNPESCQLLIMTNGGRLTARALVWKLNSIGEDGKQWTGSGIEPIKLKEKPEYFMDRVYYTKDHQKKNMEKYAEDKGWAYGTGDWIIYKGSEFESKMSVRVNKLDYSPYPYLDTFKRYDFKTGLLWNDRERHHNVRGHILTDTQGSYHKSQYKPGIIKRFKDYLFEK